MNKNKKQHLINSEIKVSEVRLADHGVMSIQEAIRLANEADMDLVLLSDKSFPPVCRIMNYEKFIYEQKKKPKSKTLDIKEIKLGPNTHENDIAYRTKHIIEFLQKGHKIKLSMQFRGREMAFVDRGQALMLKLIVSVEEYGVAESIPKMEGKRMFATIRPKNHK